MAFLQGTIDDDIPVSLLRGNRYVVEDVIGMVERPEYDVFYEKHIDQNGVAFMLWPREPSRQMVIFPPPKGLNINMMPIIMGMGIFRSLPEECRQYAEFI